MFAKGRTRKFLVETDVFRLAIISVVARDSRSLPHGESILHTHPAGDHSFVVLKGAARFSFPANPDVC